LGHRSLFLNPGHLESIRPLRGGICLLLPLFFKFQGPYNSCFAPFLSLNFTFMSLLRELLLNLRAGTD